LSGKTIESLEGMLGMKQPDVAEGRTASVAVILRKEAEISILLIERSERVDDPWSGQIAFPGGKSQPGDSSLMETAERETEEEVGIDLKRSSRFMGYHAPVRTHTGTMLVVPSVFELKQEVDVRPNLEVQSYRWVPVSSFTNGSSDSTYGLLRGGVPEKLPAFKVGDYVIWGLTYRLIRTLFGPG
jgi:8-oxo-dGTP pyrophosphatase MutT (NUDIX family)